MLISGTGHGPRSPGEITSDRPRSPGKITSDGPRSPGEITSDGPRSPGPRSSKAEITAHQSNDVKLWSHRLKLRLNPLTPGPQPISTLRGRFPLAWEKVFIVNILPSFSYHILSPLTGLRLNDGNLVFVGFEL